MLQLGYTLGSGQPNDDVALDQATPGFHCVKSQHPAKLDIIWSVLLFKEDKHIY